MNQKELKELIEFLIEKDIAEFELERGDVKVRIKRAYPNLVNEVQTGAAAQPAPAATQPAAVAAYPAPASPTAAPGTAAVDSAEQPGMHTIRSPIVGTFYEAPSPGAPPFVKPGDAVTVGQVLCIIEAMKLMNEIESDYAGEVVKRHVSNAQPVEYGQPLFTIRAQ